MTDLRSVRPPLFVSILVLATAAYAFLPALFRPPASPWVGRDAPDLEIPITPIPFVLRQHRGQVVVLAFMATWSDLEGEQQKRIDEVVRKQDAARVRVVGIVTADSRENLDAWRAKHPPEFPLAFDEDEHLARVFDVNNLPAFVIVSPTGRVSSVRPAGLEASELTKLIEQAR